MPQTEDAGQESQSNQKPAEVKNGPKSVKNTEKVEKSESTKASSAKDESKVSPGLQAIASTISQRRSFLTIKPEGIQISRSKHWKFISSYHGPYLLA